MATGASDQLNRKQIVRLGAAISANNMESIAEGYMDFSNETVKNIRRDSSTSEAFNRDVILHWAYRNPENQVEKLAALLYKAASDCSYVDPRKVEDILGAASREGRPSPKSQRQSQEDATSVTEEEFQTLAENLRPWTEKAMKIEVAPWIKEYVVDMDDLYTDLILEKIHNKPTGYFRKRIKNYEELFVVLEEDQGKSMLSRVPGKKILIKADPGIGKTTLVKKIAWDWAKKLFTKVTMVNFVFLKLVKPGDTIESVIIDQTPELEGLGVTKEKLKSMLQKCGEKCLLILDGLDEHAFGKNQDVLEIVRHEKCLFCNVLLTSRPHSTRDIERYFDTIVSVEGFTQSEVRKFALKIVPDANKVEDILRFNPTGLSEKISLYNCPILLSFLCLLVREDDIDLSSRGMCTGEMYIRMVRCLYKKYLIRKGREFEESKCAAVLTLIGSLALKTLLSGKILFKRSDVIEEIGDDAFDYGLLIGHEDFRLIRDETADILIAFAHRSIQEFLGCFCFIQKLTGGSRIDSLLGVDCQEPIFMVNPLFLHFCLWLLYCSEKYVSFQNKESTCETLKSFMQERIDCTQLHISDIVRLYPAVDFERAVNEDDRLSMKFFGSILKGIHRVKSLTLRTEDPLEWLLKHLSAAYANLTLIKVCGKTYTSAFQGVTFYGLFQETLTMTLPQFTTSDFCDEHLNIVLSDEIYRSGMLEKVLKHLKNSKGRPLAVYLYLQDGEVTNLSNLLEENFHKVHVLSTRPANVTLIREVMHCPSLSHLSMVGLLTLDKRVFLELDKAVQSGNLPSLRFLSLAGATFVDSQLDCLILSQWSFLKYLNLFDCKLSDSEISVLSLLRTTSLVISGNRILNASLENDTESSSESRFFDNRMSYFRLEIYDLTGKGYLELIDVLSKKQLSHLKDLNLSMAQQENCCLRDLKPDFIPQLEVLRLERCIASLDDLKHLSEIVNVVNGWELRVLDISHSSGISRHLSVLMEHCFPFLHTLVLSDCGLYADDLRSLAEAKVNNRLPELRHLDISHNIDNLDCLFSFECKWEKLVYLNVRNDFGLKDYIHYLEHYVGLGCLCSLQTIRFYVNTATRAFHSSGERGTIWPNLTTMEIVSTLNDVEHALTYASDITAANSFPELRTVCVVVKPKVDPNLAMYALGDDWSDMLCFRVRNLPRNDFGQVYLHAVLKIYGLGDDWPDMFDARNTPPNFQHQSESVPVQRTDKKFAEALYELKNLGVEVHVWFSGDEQTYQESRSYVKYSPCSTQHNIRYTFLCSAPGYVRYSVAVPVYWTCKVYVYRLHA